MLDWTRPCHLNWLLPSGICFGVNILRMAISAFSQRAAFSSLCLSPQSAVLQAASMTIQQCVLGFS
ncbi:hypothetical protein BRADI_3g24656v3 [Brachypodium distachyon]|uniref:Uncharacterized protein n=1 Tax=Brachypodium distachyon TaxID=15368 RepID=A0A2K2CZ55_BRADI|nr:hypothetical protein BRADI_3g24656v3 [Brachypodium distachyon]